MQVELKDLKDGTKNRERFRAAESVERVFIEEKVFEYLYSDQKIHTFMNPEDYEQLSLDENLLTAQAAFLQEGMKVTIGFYENEAISVTLPSQVVLTVVEADPVVKGQTATSSFKPAKLDNGLKTMVPPHIEVGTRVIVHTEDATYVERYKES